MHQGVTNGFGSVTLLRTKAVQSLLVFIVAALWLDGVYIAGFVPLAFVV